MSTLSTRGPADRLVELRMRRQERLYAADDPLKIHMVLDEGVLHRPVGGERVLQEQLERLIADSQRPNITIQVLPFSVGAHCSVDGSFVVLAFPDSDDNDLVYVEGHLGDLYLEKEHDIDVYERMFDELLGMCMTAEHSVELIAKFLRHY